MITGYNVAWMQHSVTKDCMKVKSKFSQEFLNGSRNIFIFNKAVLRLRLMNLFSSRNTMYGVFSPQALAIAASE
jgi:hypothetical protein